MSLKNYSRKKSLILSKGWTEPSDGNNFSDVYLAGYLNVSLSSFDKPMRPWNQECVSHAFNQFISDSSIVVKIIQ